MERTWGPSRNLKALLLSMDKVLRECGMSRGDLAEGLEASEQVVAAWLAGSAPMPLDVAFFIQQYSDDEDFVGELAGIHLVDIVTALVDRRVKKSRSTWETEH